MEYKYRLHYALGACTRALTIVKISEIQGRKQNSNAKTKWKCAIARYGDGRFVERQLQLFWRIVVNWHRDRYRSRLKLGKAGPRASHHIFSFLLISIRKRLTCKGSGFFLGGICCVMGKG
jgi:hypothetical protein